MLLCIAVAAPANAQRVELGVIGGVNMSDLRIADDAGVGTDTDGSKALSIGVTMEVGLNTWLFLQVAPMYSQSGATLLIADATTVDMDARLSFIETPLQLKLTLPGRIRPFVAAGPTVGYVLTSSLGSEIGGITFEGNANDVVHRLNVALGAAAGISTRIGRSTLFFETRYTSGLTDLFTGGPVEFRAGNLTQLVDYPDFGEIKTQSLRFLIGATIPVMGSD